MDNKQNNLTNNVVAGLNNTYTVVAKRHIHPWYSWALFAATIGFAVGALYVANQNLQFNASHADELEPVQHADIGQNLSYALTPIEKNPDSKALRIFPPAALSSIKTNPRITINFDPAQIPTAARFEFQYALADAKGHPIGPFISIEANRHKSIFTPNQATFVTNGFEKLPPGRYLIRASILGLPNVYSDVVLIKAPNPVVASTGVCDCQKMVVEDKGQYGNGSTKGNGTQHWLKVIATGEHMVSCDEYQKINSTVTITTGDESIELFIADQGVNNWVMKATNKDKSLNFFPITKPEDVNESNTTDDDYKSETDSGGINKKHSDNKIEWDDAPGFQMSKFASELNKLKKSWTITYQANLLHVVGSCKCVTGVSIKVKDGVVTENKLDPICQ